MNKALDIELDAGTREGSGVDSFAAYELHISIAVLCLELIHELTPTLTCLRSMLLLEGFDGVDRSIVQEEASRLQKVIASLRRTKYLDEPFAPIQIAGVAIKAAARAQADVGGTLRPVVSIRPEMFVVASERALELLLTALIRNALAAATTSVLVSAQGSTEATRIEIEDDGGGVTERVEERLFRPLATLETGGRGTGTMIAARIARSHGWQLEHARRDGRTVITLHIGGVR